MAVRISVRLLLILFCAGFIYPAHAVDDVGPAHIDPAHLSGPDRQKILEEGARKEGQLLWVGSLNADNAKAVLAGFSARYPFIKVNRLRTDGSQAAERVLIELKAQKPEIDLITSSDVGPLQRAGALQTFSSPVLDGYPAQFKDPTNYSAPLYFIYAGLAAYNTNLVSAAEAPKTYEDLLAPKWKGQMVINTKESGAIFMVTVLRKMWGEEKARSYLEALSHQEIVNRSESARTIIDKVAAGEYKIMIYPFVSHVGELARLGAPVGVTLANPTPMSEDPLLLSKYAPHPYATMLLIDYLLGVEAQTALRDQGYFPGSPSVAPAQNMQAFLPETQGVGRMLVGNREAEDLMAESASWYRTMFR